MVRTAADVKRINKRFTGPFLGLSEHNEPEMIGPSRAADCNNVLMIDGRIQQRFGMSLIGVELTNLKPRALIYVPQRVSSPTADPVTYSTLGLCVLENVSTGTWWLYRKTSSANWKVMDSTVGGLGRLVLSGLLGRGNANGGIPAYNTMVYVLDGGDRVYKTPLNANYQTTIGIQPADSVDIFVPGSGTGWTGFPAGTTEWGISLCDRLQAPVGASHQHPGQESNFLLSSTDITDVNGTSKKLRFTAPYSGGVLEDAWTHARLYIKINGASYFKFVGNYARHSDFYDSVAGDKGTLRDEGSGVFDLPNQMAYVPVVTSAEAFDFRPTRNNVPDGMRHFAMFNGRGFWARGDDTIVYHTDPIAPSFAGHPEALSADYLEGFDGPTCMLAEFNNALIIGTPNGLFRLTGTLTSLTNATVETVAAVGILPAHLAPVPDTSGPMPGGLGNHLTIDNRLYFVTNRGLESFDGVSMTDLSRAIRAHGEFANSDFSLASLGVDHFNGLLYVAAPPNMWVYHFRNVDLETGVGTWTFWDKADRTHDFQCITSSDALDPNIVIGSFLASGPRGRIDALPSAWEASSESRPWSWTSGDIDLGVPDRRKRFYTLTVHGRDDQASGARVSWSLDGGSWVVTAVDFSTNTTAKIHINGYGRRLRVRFDGLTGTIGNTRILGYDVEAELIDHW